jgi:hypothetical protein
MAARLCRWLSGRRRSTPGFGSAARAYAEEGGFVDWARAALRSGDGIPAVAAAYARLSELAEIRREEENRAFADLLRDWNAGDASGEDALPIERVLDNIVAPLAAHAPVLLLVLDGLSFAVARPLPLSGDAAMALIRFFREVLPETGELMHDFTDPEWGTRFLGDLYQDLSEEARKRYALLQTPEFVESWILDRTLEPAIREFGHERVTMIDPACGSGQPTCQVPRVNSSARKILLARRWPDIRGTWGGRRRARAGGNRRWPAGAAVGRIIAERMRARLGQPIIIENVGGADGSVGTGRAARARPDGYTIDHLAEAARGIKPATIGRRVAAIRYAHKLAGCDDPSSDGLGGRGDGRNTPLVAPCSEPGEVLLVDAPRGGRLGSACKTPGDFQVGRRRCGDRFAGLEGGDGIHR